MRRIFCSLFLLASNWLAGQNPIPVQVSLPVYFENVEFTHLQSKTKPPINRLCGMALLFLDTSKVQEKFLVSGLNDPIIWFDRKGISTQVKFILSDSTASARIELIYANDACTVNILKNEQSIATGSITNDFGIYALRLIGNEALTNDLNNLIDKLNYYLLRLHTKPQKNILISQLFDRDSLNVILGYDNSYDTNFDLMWFDETLRDRIKNLAIKAYISIENDESKSPIKETLETNARVDHYVEKISGEGNLIRGKVSTVFKMQGDKDYLFLRAKEEYLMEINYGYEKWENNADRLMIDKFSIKNIGNDDFVEMEVFDYTWNGIPVLFIDLINGVVMEDKGTWQADHFISVIQDIFRLVKLPNEG